MKFIQLIKHNKNKTLLIVRLLRGHDFCKDIIESNKRRLYKMREVVIASAVRTPVGSFGGALKDLSAVDLGVTATKEALRRANIQPDAVDEVLVGNILAARCLTCR